MTVTRGTRMLVVLAASLALFVAFAPLRPAHAQNAPWTVRDYDVTITIDDDSTLQVTERIQVNFTGDQHGIFREWEAIEDLPSELPAGSTIELEGDPADYQRHYDIDVTGVTSSTAAPTDLDLTMDGDTLRARIGDPDRTVRGQQSYEITYTVAGAMNTFSDHDELFWDPIGTWPVDIADLRVEVRRDGIGQVACYAGLAGTSDTTCPATIGDGGAEFEFGRVPVGVYPSIVVGLPTGVVDVAAPIIEPVPTFWSTLRDGLFGSPLAVGFAALVGVLGAFLLGSLAWRNSRDVVAVGGVTANHSLGRDVASRRRGLFERPPVPVEFRPPEQLPPGLLGVVIDERVDPVDVSATIVDLARRGYLRITEVEATSWFSKEDWTLTRVPGAPEADLSAWELEVVDGLFSEGLETRISDLKGTFSGTYSAVQTMLYEEVTTSGLFITDPTSARGRWQGGALALVAVGLVAGFFGMSSGWGGVGLAMVGLGILGGILSSSAPARTAAGSRLLTRTLGFKEFIERAEAGRMDFAEKEQIFSDYLPYAVVFGVVDRWAEAFAEIGVDIGAAVGGYYVGHGAMNASGLSRGLNSFSSVASTAVSTAPPSSSGGGSGFGGGGFSGGGGGGGGGGAW